MISTPDSGYGGMLDILTTAFWLLILAVVILAAIFGVIMYLTWPRKRKK